MKKYRTVKICLTLCLLIGLVMIPKNQLKVQAEEIIATVHGTILSGTTSEMLYLSTEQGKMEIKLDSKTDTSECKILLPDRKINVSVSRGSDNYLHAVKITSNSTTANITYGSAGTVTISGKLSEKTKDDLLYVSTPQGEMEIKFDSTTSLNGCSFLVMGKTYSIACVRGSDAYMHAVSITDTASSVSNSQVNNANTTSITGKVDNRTKENLLYLSTNDGVMEIVIDSNTDTRKGMILMPGRKLTVSFYRGSDAYLHAASIVGEKDNPSNVTIDRSSPSTATGTVAGDSTENMMYLLTPQGKMELKLDAVNSLNYCKVLTKDRKVTVTFARGSDAYMHAIDISGS